jgi:hypothetical protein
VVKYVRKTIEKHIPKDFPSGINENTPIQIQNLSAETRNQEPDICLENEKKMKKYWKVSNFAVHSDGWRTENQH